MKRQIFIILTLVLLISVIQINGQVLVIKKDSISFGKDSVAILTLPTYRGDIYWQQSLDNINWVTSTINGKDSLIIPLRFNANYRAKIIDGNCSPIFSDTAKIIVIDSIKTIFANSLLEIAYPDSTGEIVKFTYNRDTFACEKVNGEYIFQGDIVLTTKQIQLFSELKGGGISPTEFNAELWPENKVYYTIDNSLNEDERIISAIKHWETNTSIRFIKRENQENYIEFIWDENTCCSNLGMVGEKQLLKLADWGTSGSVIHEIGHAIGLIHEHSREDRESFITVVDSNITTDWKDQFTIVPYATISTKTFDFNSIMIYSGLINNSEIAIDPTKPVMIKKSDGLPWDAQRNNLSIYDIEIVKKMYPPLKPTILTTELANITQTTATGGGNVTADGGATVTVRGVCWNTTGNPTIANSKTTNGTGTSSFTSNLTGLTANTPYYVRAYATNSLGTAYGNQVTFTTGKAITQPAVTTTSITAITQTTATGGGNVTADGGATVTARGVCWNTTGNPTTASSKTINGKGTGSFTSNFTGLTSNTLYYVRAYATNNQGTAYGNEVTYTTTSNDITADFSDPNFLAAVREVLGKGTAEPIYSTDNFAAVLWLNLKPRNIKSLEGLKYFISLTWLGCDDNQLTSLPQLPSNLIVLWCRNNQLSSLPTLPPNLQVLGCDNNLLTTLPALPSSLTGLMCKNNKLVLLPDLPSGLSELYCQNNQLTSLPVIPSGVTYLHCFNNQLTSLPALPSVLKQLFCNDNKLTSLPILPSDNLTALFCANNLLTSLPALPSCVGSLDCSYNRLTGIKLNSTAKYYDIDVSYNYMKSEADVTGQVIKWDNCWYKFWPQND